MLNALQMETAPLVTAMEECANHNVPFTTRVETTLMDAIAKPTLTVHPNSAGTTCAKPSHTRTMEDSANPTQTADLLAQ